MDNSQKDIFSGLQFDLSAERPALASQNNESYGLGPDFTVSQKNSPLREPSLDPFHFEKPPAIPPLPPASSLTVHQCESYPPLPDQLQPETQTKNKKSRPRVRQQPGYSELRKAKNKLFARESRQRQRLHVEQLEEEVAALRAELSIYKSRYELIERHRSVVGSEAIHSTYYVQQEIAAGRCGASDSGKLLTRIVGFYMAERRKVLEQLSRLIVELAMPTPMKYSLWRAENGLDMMDPATVKMLTGNALSEKQLAENIERVKKIFPDKRLYEEHQKKLAESSQSLRKHVKQLVEAQKGIQEENHKVWMRLRTSIFKNYDLCRHGDNMRWLPKLNENPELSDCSLYHIKDDDFCLNTCDDIEGDLSNKS